GQALRLPGVRRERRQLRRPRRGALRGRAGLSNRRLLHREHRDRCRRGARWRAGDRPPRHRGGSPRALAPAPPWAGVRPGGAHGCLEALASGNAIRKRYGVAPEELDDPSAWAEIGRWLGLAVVNTVALLDCDVVVFGGGVVKAWERFDPELRRAELGDDRNVWGAMTLVRGLAPPATLVQ